MASFTLGTMGARTVLGIILESTFGTDPTGTTTTIALKSSSLDETSTFDEGADLWAGTGGVATQRLETSRDSGGEITGLLGYSGIGLILQAAFGTKNTTGAGPYAHAFSLSRQAALPSLTLREAVRDPDADDHHRVFSGCVVNELTLDFKARGSIAEYSASILAKALDSHADATPAAPAAPDLVLGSHLTTFSFNSVSYVTRIRSLKIRLQNGLARQDAMGTLTMGGVVPTGRRQVSVEAQMLLGADQIGVIDTARRAGTRADLTITFTGPSSQTLAFAANDAQVVSCPHPATQYGERLCTVTFRPIDDLTNLGLVATLTNNNASSAT